MVHADHRDANRFAFERQLRITVRRDRTFRRRGGTRIGGFNLPADRQKYGGP
jgi:hypothetical protein